MVKAIRASSVHLLKDRPEPVATAGRGDAQLRIRCPKCMHVVTQEELRSHRLHGCTRYVRPHLDDRVS